MTIIEPAAWIDDHCRSGRIVPVTRERARGILILHATCEPPCPRSLSARAYLDTLPKNRQQ